MNILYFAKHGSGGNDDEGAVAYALRALGHDVEEVHERHADLGGRCADLLLCHHPADPARLAAFHGPKVYWCFDRVVGWSNERSIWAAAMRDVCDLGFHTDGDFVDQDRTGKLRWLPQGADERRLASSIRVSDHGVLFVGSIRGRESFVDWCFREIGGAFHHVPHGVHGDELMELIRRTAVVVAPDSPVSDRYWSNRVYLILSMGGFLLHPWSAGLAEQYGGLELMMYKDRRHLLQLLTTSNDVRAAYVAAGLKATIEKHLYRHRCAELMRYVAEFLCA